MGDKGKLSGTARILWELQNSESAKHKRIERDELEPQIKLLKTFQAERLAQTYADLLATKRYGPASQFFLTDIYAPKDFSQRDHDAERIYHLMRKFLPERMLYLLAKVLELNNLTETLDHQLIEVLVNQLDVSDTITPELYAEAYRICDNFQERYHQIETIIEVGWGVDRLIKNPLTVATLRIAKVPAYRAGWHELHDFLARGYEAFKAMRGSKKFLETLETREKRILNQIFSADPDPFAI
jgi:hypothetical protein